MKLPASLFLAGFMLVGTQPAKAEMITINVNRVCAAIVGIPYASDNFADAEWEQFKKCRTFIQHFNGVE